ncbi:DUF4270 family protein [Odoribacter lunatus]|uniref:DUF4270 family protein n=1 Tax=Odoribacter lunatus TaxID=2941335 RepID=UPI00203AA482|nr:DUF4270 family protein [Odoribacter lunatus]
MRNFLFIFCLIFCWACNNDVTSIGQDLINDESYVELVQYNIENSATIKIDSFPTSTGKTGSSLTNLIVGAFHDPITGLTTAQPYFSLVPTGGSTINIIHNLDSITFNLQYNGQIWGDTNQVQTFRLYQLSRLPILDPLNDLLYNTTHTPYNPTPLGTYQILAKTQNLNKFCMRLDDEVGKELFEKVKFGNEIVTNAHYFVQYFKGITLVPDENNSCIFGFSSATDSVSIQLHFHDAENQLSYKFTPSVAYSEYTYENIHNDAAGTPYDVLTEQTQSLSFYNVKVPNARYGQVVTQGLSGYAIKMRLPIAPAGDKYKTIVKAEIVLRPQQGSYNEIKLSEVLYLYQSNSQNDLVSTINKADGSVITGSLVREENKPEEERYVINITDYYNSLCQDANADGKNYVIVSVPADLMSSNFNRLTVDRIPVLNIYYARYE